MLLALLLLASRFEERDPGQPGPFEHVELDVDGTRLLCPKTDPTPQLVVLLGAGEALAQHLVSHGWPVLLGGKRSTVEHALKAPCGEPRAVAVVATGTSSAAALQLVDALDLADVTEAHDFRVVLIDPVDGALHLQPPRPKRRAWNDWVLGSMLILQHSGAPTPRRLMSDAFAQLEIEHVKLKAADEKLERQLVTGWLFNAWEYEPDWVFYNLYVYPAVMSGALTESREPPDKVEQFLQFNLSAVGGIDVQATGPAGRITFRPELIFLRKSARHLGLGPYLEVGAIVPARFHFGAGVTLVVPLTGSVAVAPSFGAYATQLEPGITAGVFIGWRSFNDISHFEGLFGLRLDGRFGFGPSAERALSAALQVDLTVLAALLSFG